MISVLDSQQGAPAPEEEGADADISIGSVNALVLRLDVSGCEPPIWRRIVVREDMWVQQLHDTIQIAFDWYDYQTHSFTFGKTHYGNPVKYKEGVTEEVEDDRDVTLKDIDLTLHAELFYYYYFGEEAWCVTINVEKVFPVEEGAVYPSCVAGERAGPPEDCGGTDAYKDMLACLKEPHSELGEEWREWLGPGYDPEWCDLKEINKLLAGIETESDRDKGKGKGKT